MKQLKINSGADAPLARFESGVAVSRGLMYVFGGHLEPELSATVAMYVYDPVADLWSRCADAPHAISHVTAAVVDDRYIWFAGGFVGQHPGKGTRMSYRYDTVRDTWEDGAPLPKVRASGGFVYRDRLLHYFGGLGGDRRTNFDDHWILDPNRPEKWERLAPIPKARTHAGATVLNGGIYAIGGHYGHDLPPNQVKERHLPDLDFVHRYDFDADKWVDVAPLPMRRSHCEPGTFVHEGRIYCVGGRNNSPGALPSHQRFSPTAQCRRVWHKLRRKFFATSPGHGLSDIICFDPTKDRWTTVGSLPMDLYAPAAAMINGEIIVTNGGRAGWADPSDRTMRLVFDS